MTIRNAYCTLNEFKDYITSPQNELEASDRDDGVIERLIVSASRRIDDMCNRRFYPRIETKSYDVPNGRALWLEDDLLEVITLTNGDDNTIASTEYIFNPKNEYPKYAIILTEATSTLWEEDSSFNTEQVIDLLAYWGYHDRYSLEAWGTAGTLGAAWNSATTLTATLTAGHTLDANGGQIIKIDNELFNTSNAEGTTLAVLARGDNGSTAATHDNASTIYVWQNMDDINQLALEITNMMYKSRFGENVETVSTLTSAGVVVTPRSVPIWAREIINRYKRVVW